MNINLAVVPGCAEVLQDLGTHRQVIEKALQSMDPNWFIVTKFPILIPALQPEARDMGTMNVWWPTSNGLFVWVDELGRMWAAQHAGTCVACMVRGIDTSVDEPEVCSSMGLVVPN